MTDWSIFMCRRALSRRVWRMPLPRSSKVRRSVVTIVISAQYLELLFMPRAKSECLMVIMNRSIASQRGLGGVIVC